jgi:hypothetical protein
VGLQFKVAGAPVESAEMPHTSLRVEPLSWLRRHQFFIDLCSACSEIHQQTGIFRPYF